MTTRTSVVVLTSLWRTPGFLELDAAAQRMYLLLFSQRGLSLAGRLPLTPRRWAGFSKGDSPESVLTALAALEAARFIWVDYETEEVLVRGIVPTGHKGLQGALQASLAIESPTLRQLAIDVLYWAHRETRAVILPRPNHRFSKMRLAVHRRDGFRCLRCDWETEVPAGYDGSHAIGDVSFDEATRRFVVRILELDHIHPESLGGKFVFENLQTLCNSCNASKGARVA